MYTIDVTFESKNGASKTYPYVGDKVTAQARLNKARHQSNCTSVTIGRGEQQAVYVHDQVHAPWQRVDAVA